VSAPLTPEQIATVERHLLRFADKMSPCPVCGGKKWDLAAETGIVHMGSPAPVTFPVVLFACWGCGFVLHFSAVLAGLLPRGI
jgi:hypothetical protein